MFEGPIKAANVAGGKESPVLRQLRWTDLVARIAATRETRIGSCELSTETDASFAAFHRTAENDAQTGVNRDALRHGKLSRLFPPDAAQDAGEGDREKQ